MPHSKLSSTDQKKVDVFLQTGVNEPDRLPFRPWKLLGWLAVIIVVVGTLARLVKLICLPEY